MAAIRVTQVVLEVLTASGASAGGAASAISLTGTVSWTVSGIAGVSNVVIAKGTVVSGSWSVSGTSAFTYSWTFGQVANYAGFVSTATTSIITRTFSVAGGALGIRQVSTTVTDVSAASLTSGFTVRVAALVWPNLHDGILKKESQKAKRVWPL